VDPNEQLHDRCPLAIALKMRMVQYCVSTGRAQQKPEHLTHLFEEQSGGGGLQSIFLCIPTDLSTLLSAQYQCSTEFDVQVVVTRQRMAVKRITKLLLFRKIRHEKEK
jgi:hypothetical protein